MTPAQKKFDAAALRTALARNRREASSAVGRARKADLADAGLQVACAELGLDREAANELMAECLRAAVDDPTADPQQIRRQNVPAWLAIGMAYGYLGHLRLDREADAAEGMVTLRLTRGSADRLEDHLTRQFGEGRLVQEIRAAIGVTGPEPEPMGGG